MKSCAGEEARELRIKLQRTDICYRELEQERIYLQRSKQRDLQGTHKKICLVASHWRKLVIARESGQRLQVIGVMGGYCGLSQ